MTITEHLINKAWVGFIIAVVVVVGACSATAEPVNRPPGTAQPITTTTLNQDPRRGWVEFEGGYTLMHCDNGPNMIYEKRGSDSPPVVVVNHPACEAER